MTVRKLDGGRGHLSWLSKAFVKPLVRLFPEGGASAEAGFTIKAVGLCQSTSTNLRR